MKLTCDEATIICDKSQYNEATFLEIIKLKLHILLCKNCRNYSGQNKFITKCIDKTFLLNNKEMHLNDSEKQKMEYHLKEKL